MNWETFGLLAAVVVLLLFTPLRLWAFARAHNIKITKLGYIFYSVMVGVLIVGYSLGYLASETEFGKYVGTPKGALIYTITIFIVFGFLATVLHTQGITLAKKIT